MRVLGFLLTHPGRLLAALALSSAAFGCQAILGDFEIEPAPVEDTSLGTACAPGAARCTEGTLEVCAANRQSFEVAAECGRPELCDPTAQACHPCTAGDYACNGAALSSCSAAGQWQLVTTCAAPEVCAVEDNRRSGRCLPALPQCANTEFVCDGRVLLRCTPGGDRLELVERCVSVEYCDAAAANDQAANGEPVHCLPSCSGDECGAPGCIPGTTRCSPMDVPALEQCNADGEWIQRELCTTRQLCNATAERCLPPACLQGERRCRGEILERCAGDFTRFVEDKRCTGDQACDPTLGCIAPGCTEGAFRCNGRTVERCQDGVWDPRNVCVTADLCEAAGFCVDPVCQGSECEGDILKQCDSGRDEWNVLYPQCAADERCTPFPNPRPAPRTYCETL
jgi:hypothetical protein